MYCPWLEITHPKQKNLWVGYSSAQEHFPHSLLLPFYIKKYPLLSQLGRLISRTKVWPFHYTLWVPKLPCHQPKPNTHKTGLSQIYLRCTQHFVHTNKTRQAKYELCVWSEMDRRCDLSLKTKLETNTRHWQLESTWRYLKSVVACGNILLSPLF